MGLLDSNAEELLPLDDNGGRITIDYPHHEIHEGNHYTVNYTKTMDTVTAHTVTITTPTSTSGYVHFNASVELTGAGTWTFSSAPESSGGSTLTAYNNNRVSTNTSGTVIAGGVTWTSAGTVLETHYIGANNPGSKLGGYAEARNEWLLASSTKYGLRVANDAATVKSSINLFFYVD